MLRERRAAMGRRAVGGKGGWKGQRRKENGRSSRGDGLSGGEQRRCRGMGPRGGGKGEGGELGRGGGLKVAGQSLTLFLCSY